MALNNRKKTLLSLIAAVASIGILAGCDDVKALPAASNYDAPILSITGDKNITNNTMGQIYDALVKEGDTNSAKVLSNILYLYSTTIYGNLFDKTVNGATVKGLKTVVDEYEADNTNTKDIQAFADAYSAYANEDGTHSIYKVVNFYLEVLSRLRTTFYGYVTNSSYQLRSQFQEKLFYDTQEHAYYTLGKAYGTDYKQVDGSFRLSETYAESGTTILDAKGVAADFTKAYFQDIFGTYQNYIELSLLPDIYRSELTAQYLYTQNLGQLKLTPARKIDYITLADNTSYPASVGELIRSYSAKVIETGKDASLYGFPFLANLYKGTLTGMSTEQVTLANEIYDDAGWSKDSITVNGTQIDFRKQSGYGTIALNYQKLTDSRYTDDETVRSDFTNSGAYTVATGLAIKTKALIAQDKTTHGWYTSSTALSGLVSSLSSRLFKVQTAYDVDSNKSANETMKFGRYVGGNYYLVPDLVEDTDKYPYIVHDASNWYIVKVSEAASYAKLDTNNADCYDKMDAHKNDHGVYAEKIAREIAYSLASSDTYKNTSNQYYVEQMAVLYHDTYVYKYFKKTFPDIFD
jgi:hypothetical protein